MIENKYALLSVFDKTGILELAQALIKNGYSILATGNTSKILQKNGIETEEVADLTKYPEAFHGRVKTLHPKIFGGILYRRNEMADIEDAKTLGIPTIEVVCVNLYPFIKVAEDPSADISKLIDNIDIGGPSMVRAAAKNYSSVYILTDPGQYSGFIEKLSANLLDVKYRQQLAIDAFAHTAFYESVIYSTLKNKFNSSNALEIFTTNQSISLRYGENPHQKASLLGNFFEYFEHIHGKELSYNNILDIHSAVSITQDLPKNSCVIVKHNNPCGAAYGESLLEVYEKALSCDPVAAFGGIVSFNDIIDEDVARKLNEIFLEVIIAPAFSAEALEILKKKKDRRLLIVKQSLIKTNQEIKTVFGGFLKQEVDNGYNELDSLKAVTKRIPTEHELADMKFAWIISKYVKSNAIVFVHNKMTIGIGAGQVSRIDSVKIAGMKAKEFGHEISGAVAASDAFFPFTDGVIACTNYGITSIIQPGGSVRDGEVIEKANELNLAMVFTGKRHFKH